MHLADLIIHVNETLAASERTALEDVLRQSNGVVAPRFNKETPHLLLVAYNPEQIDSHKLLHQVKAGGYTAQLLGM
ncbi:hypothetical protein [Sulfuriflexus mobilis]|uniref:hypothetical protein n=1 Tax=Sulfuriflexus mobilis TaxID=1811807 RepID=UPI000F825D84|nr:hypothetical protein [Sulfuriflexus mobilis]